MHHAGLADLRLRRPASAYRGDEYDAVRKFGVALTAPQPHRFADVCGADGSAVPRPRRRRLAAHPSGRRRRLRPQRQLRASRRSSPTSTRASPGASTLHRNVIFRNDHVPFPTRCSSSRRRRGCGRSSRPPASTPAPAATCSPSRTTRTRATARCSSSSIPAPRRIDERARAGGVPRRDGAAGRDLSSTRATRSASTASPASSARPTSCATSRSAAARAVRGLRRRHRAARRRAARAACRGSTSCAARCSPACKENERLGVNPYRLGIIASTDTHNGTPGATDGGDVHRPSRHRRRHAGQAARPRRAHARRHHLQPRRPRRRVGRGELAPEHLRRAAPRARCSAPAARASAVRFFGGWNLPAGLCDDPQHARRRPTRRACRWAARWRRAPPGAARADVRRRRRCAIPGTADASGHAAAAPADRQGLDRERRGAPAGLRRRRRSEQRRHRRPATCAPHGTGADSLCTRVDRPGFDPAQQAFYYVRVRREPDLPLEHVRLQRAAAGRSDPPACSDPTVPEDDPGARLDARRSGTRESDRVIE